MEVLVAYSQRGNVISSASSCLNCVIKYADNTVIIRFLLNDIHEYVNEVQKFIEWYTPLIIYRPIGLKPRPENVAKKKFHSKIVGLLFLH